MLQKRIIPCLLFKDHSLVKSIQFQNPKYVGDPINAVRIFNEKEVDELILLDIAASRNGDEPNYEMIEKIGSECFMPLCYGGGVTTLHQMQKVFQLGVEKISLNSILFKDPHLLSAAARIFGSQSVVAAFDVKKVFWHKYRVFKDAGRKSTGLDPIAYAKKLESLGAGELLVTSIDRDGTQEGYDLELMERITAAVNIPVIASGGAGSITDFVKVTIQANAAAAAAGSMFVFQGKYKAVLISYPEYDELETYFKQDSSI